VLNVGEEAVNSTKQSALIVAFLIIVGANANQCVAKSSSIKEEAKGSSGLPHSYNAHALHRLDFRVVGKSCGLCLHQMQERMRELPGIVDVGVMMVKPYGAAVIYDSTKVRADKIFAKAKEGVPEVSFEDKKDVPIKTVPKVLVPAAAAEGEDFVRTK
jgi:hypothetical protein